MNKTTATQHVKFTEFLLIRESSDAVYEATELLIR
jgi:hypothetical protein